MIDEVQKPSDSECENPSDFAYILAKCVFHAMLQWIVH
jgi:hypothetical protein